jgi:peptide/nickel transport system substrate-binding protein
MLAAFSVVVAIATVPVAQARSGAGPARAKPVAGGTISVRTEGGEYSCVDPAVASGTSGGIVANIVAETLVNFSNDGKVLPNLATSWKASNGGRALTLQLRRGARFSNGETFDANAVKYTFLRGLDPAIKSPQIPGLLGQLKSITVVSTYVVRLNMKAPSRIILANLANPQLGILAPKATKAGGPSKTCSKPIGTGSFAVKTVGPGFDQITLSRNPYRTWGPPNAHNQGLPYLSQIVVKNVADETTATSELLSGGLDYAFVNPDQLTRLTGASGIKVRKYLQQGEGFLSFNESHAPFNNVQVRRAIIEAIDRKAVLQAALNGQGKVADSPIGATIPYFDKNAGKYLPNYNPADARKILAANHVTGPYTILTWDYNGLKTAAEVVQAQLAQVGVTVNIVSKGLADYVGVAAKGDFDINFFNYGYYDPDILNLYWDSVNETANGYNYTFRKDSKLDAWIVQGEAAVNHSAAVKIYNQAQEYMNKNAVILPLYSAYNVFANTARLHDMHTILLGYLPIYQDLWVSK